MVGTPSGRERSFGALSVRLQTLARKAGLGCLAVIVRDSHGRAWAVAAGEPTSRVGRLPRQAGGLFRLHASRRLSPELWSLLDEAFPGLLPPEARALSFWCPVGAGVVVAAAAPDRPCPPRGLDRWLRRTAPVAARHLGRLHDQDWLRALETVIGMVESGKKALGRRLHSESAQLLSAAVLELDLLLMSAGDAMGEGMRSRLEGVVERIRQGAGSVGSVSRRLRLAQHEDVVEAFRWIDVGLTAAQMRFPSEPVELPMLWRVALLEFVEVALDGVGPHEKEFAFLTLEAAPEGGYTVELTVDPEEMSPESVERVESLATWIESLDGRMRRVKDGFRVQVPGC